MPLAISKVAPGCCNSFHKHWDSESSRVECFQHNNNIAWLTSCLWQSPRLLQAAAIFSTSIEILNPRELDVFNNNINTAWLSSGLCQSPRLLQAAASLSTSTESLNPRELNAFNTTITQHGWHHASGYLQGCFRLLQVSQQALRFWILGSWMLSTTTITQHGCHQACANLQGCVRLLQVSPQAFRLWILESWMLSVAYRFTNFLQRL